MIAPEQIRFQGEQGLQPALYSQPFRYYDKGKTRLGEVGYRNQF